MKVGQPVQRSFLTLLILGAGVLALAGCGGSGGGGGSGASATTATSTRGGVRVVMKDIAFDPRAVTARVGQTITWVNDDDVLHDAVAKDGTFESSLFGKGKSFSWTPTRAGTIAYVCTVHPGMTGTVTVRR
jgi:plastocyanin